MSFSLDTFVSIDLETTGLDAGIDKIIEIGAVKYDKGVKVGTFSRLVNPGISIPPDITALTGIDDAMVESASPIEAAIQEFESFIGEKPLFLGQNIRFDLAFLKNHLPLKYLAEIDQYFLDSAALARLVWPGLKGYGLSSLAEFLNISVDSAHRALPDAEIAAQVYLYQLAALSQLPQKIKNFAAGIIFGAPYRSQVLQSLDRLSDQLPKPVPYDYDYGDNIIGETSLEPRDDFIEIDNDIIKEIFDKNLRNHLDDYEERPQQLEMAARVTSALNNAEILLSEAPTGVGKSLAYLVPALLWSKANGESILISTQTKNLQDQLFNKDIPLIKEAIGFDFKALLLKGRGNYLCLLKYYELLNEAINSYGPDERLALMSAIVWAETTKTGDIAECTGFYPGRFRYLWSRMSCEGNFCLGRVCQYYKKCFLYKMKNVAATTHLRVINHYLLFADLSAGGDLIRSSGLAVLDEAHNLEKVAASYLGPEVNQYQFITAFNQIYTIKPIETGFLSLVKSKMVNLDSHTEISLDGTIAKIRSKLLKARGKMSEFFEKLANALAKIPSSYENAKEISYTSMTGFLPQDLIDDSIIAVKTIETLLMDFAGEIEMADSLKDGSELAVRARAIAMDIQELRRALEFVTYPDEKDYVYWAELGQKRDARLISAPLEVGRILDEKLYEHLKSLVLCSATLSVAGNFEYYKKRLGLDLSSADRTTEVALDSPFNLKQNIGFFEAGFLPAPNMKNYERQAADTILQLFSAIRVKGMVLFTSYRSMTAVLDSIGEGLISKGFELFIQNSNLSPFQLLTRYRQSARGIIFGTDSFWEGVDLPGEELELLVIAKLPFAVPDRPWTKANLEKIEREGGNPFMDYSLPEAVIKFRQGFGRLIRKKTDRGCVVSLDSRLTGKQYGRIFIMSVKPPLRVCPSLNSLLHAAAKYFNG